MPSAALLGAGGARDADVAEQVLPGDTSPPELKLLGLGVHPGDALLEAAAGADVSVDLCHAPEFTLMQRLPQHGNDSLFALFHPPRLWNGRDDPAGQLSSMTGVPFAGIRVGSGPAFCVVDVEHQQVLAHCGSSLKYAAM